MLRCLLAGVLALCLASLVQAQDAPPSLATNEQVAAWEGVANRAETAAETGQTSTFALGRLRTELFDWREAFSDDLNLNAGRLATIDGIVPGLFEMPTACRFAERCLGCQDKCTQDMPHISSVNEDRLVRCHFPVNAEANVTAG